MGGQSLIGQVQPGVAYPFNWLLFLSPLKHGFIRDAVFNWYIALIRFMAALACYALCRDLGRSRAASLLGACAFSRRIRRFHRMAATDQRHRLGAAGLPVLTASLRGERPLVNAILSGACLGIAWFSGHHQIPFFTTLAISAVWLYHIARKQRAERSLQFAALLATMLLVSAVQTFPAYSYGHTAVRWANASHELTWNEPVPYSVHDEFSLNPASVLGVFLESVYTHSNPFVGIVVLALAILAVALAWTETPVRIFAAVATGGLLFAFASPTILHADHLRAGPLRR